jgi:hypothetical protein
MMEELMVEWLREVTLLKKREMLTLDAFKDQLTEKVKDGAPYLLNTDLVVIPGGMTSQLQVLDMVVNKPFKDQLCCLYRKRGTVH